MAGRLTQQQWQVLVDDVTAAERWPAGSVAVVSAGPMNGPEQHDLLLAVYGMTGRRWECGPDTCLVLQVAGRELRMPASSASAHQDLRRALRLPDGP
jgi:hypothetical protein